MNAALAASATAAHHASHSASKSGALPSPSSTVKVLSPIPVGRLARPPLNGEGSQTAKVSRSGQHPTITGFLVFVLLLALPPAAAASVPNVSYSTTKLGTLQIEVSGITRQCTETAPPMPIEVFLRNGATADTVTYQCDDWDAAILYGHRWRAEMNPLARWPRIELRIVGHQSGLRRFRFRIRVNGSALESGSISVRTKYHRPKKITQDGDVDDFINVCINNNHTIKSENHGHLYCVLGGWTDRTWHVNGKTLP